MSLASSCQNHPSEPFDLTAIENYISHANETFGQRFKSNDASFNAERYTMDAVIFPVEHPRAFGRDNIGKYYFNDGQNSELKKVIAKTAVYGTRDLVVEEGDYDYPTGNGESLDRGKFIALWKQEDGKWKLFREIWNSDMAPSQ